MPLLNPDIARIFDEIAGLQEIEDAIAAPYAAALGPRYLQNIPGVRQVLLAANADAHSIYDFANLHFGLQQAQRGWLEKKDVLNTRTLKALRPLLAATMSS